MASRCCLFARPMMVMLAGLAAILAVEPALAADTLRVLGLVDNPFELSLDDLRKMPMHDVTVPAIPASSSSAGEPAREYRGIALRTILDRVKLCVRERNAARKMVVTARAKDDYAAVFAWMEIYNTPTGDGVYVALDREGAPLGADEGPLALVSTRDTRPGPRHVKWLRAIEIGSTERDWQKCP